MTSPETCPHRETTAQPVSVVEGNVGGSVMFLDTYLVVIEWCETCLAYRVSAGGAVGGHYHTDEWVGGFAAAGPGGGGA